MLFWPGQRRTQTSDIYDLAIPNDEMIDDADVEDRPRFNELLREPRGRGRSVADRPTDVVGGHDADVFCDGWPENFTKTESAAVQTATCDLVPANDAASGIEAENAEDLDGFVFEQLTKEAGRRPGVADRAGNLQRRAVLISLASVAIHEFAQLARRTDAADWLRSARGLPPVCAPPS